LLLWLLAPVAPKIGTIEVYGARRVPAAVVLRTLGVKVGDGLPGSRGELESKLEALPGVRNAQVQGHCCVSGKAVLYVGIEEESDEALVPTVPDGTALLPDEVLEAWTDYEAACKGTVPLTLSSDILCRVPQREMPQLANRHFDALRTAVAHGTSGEERAKAIIVIAYTTQKALIMGTLVNALSDPEAVARAAAAKALAALGRTGDKELTLRPGWFIPLLNSANLDERLQATDALTVGLKADDGVSMELLKDHALTALLEMAKFQNPAHARPALVVLARMAGLSEENLDSKSLVLIERTLRRR